MKPVSTFYADREALKKYRQKKKIRFLCATAIFDGHDASINIIRRFLQARGVEVIHLGHNRSASEVAQAAMQEDVDGIAVSSYQGGHVEYFTYLRELLDGKGASRIKLFGGGGGVISPKEITELQSKGIVTIYSPEDGQKLDFDGIIGHMIQSVDTLESEVSGQDLKDFDLRLSRGLSLLEQGKKTLPELSAWFAGLEKKHCKVLGTTGTGGAGKSSLVDELVQRFLLDSQNAKVGIICVDPTKKKTGGALLGDRIRMNCCASPRVFLRSFATRDAQMELAKVTKDAIALFRLAGFDWIIVETSGIGQGNSAILELCDHSLYVMTPEYGASSQLEKIDMLDFADFIAVNKLERGNGQDALKDVESTIRRSRFGGKAPASYPLFGTIANRFNDVGTNGLYRAIAEKLFAPLPDFTLSQTRTYDNSTKNPYYIIPPARKGYLAEIVGTIRKYKKNAKEQMVFAKEYECLTVTKALLPENSSLTTELERARQKLSPELLSFLDGWQSLQEKYHKDKFTYIVRGKEVFVDAKFKTLAGQNLSRVALPQYESAYEKARFYFTENTPGEFPYTAGLFPFRRTAEDPQRQFAGEGGPGRTNSRFHFLARAQRAKRLSTAFDSVTLYGSDPDKRPDIFGKIGESGVSIGHLDDMKELYKGFRLCDPATSVSMTINGPAPIILAMYINAAFDQEVEAFAKDQGRALTSSEKEEIFEKTIRTMRGTVQADILKENQAQNTCIFSTEFALKLMGDIQEYFCQNQIRNYYAVSISGYHIAEAGANPITQLAFTLANGLTYVEYYLSRGLKIDDFAPNLSFFFSNGLDAEYAVLGRVARRIWSVAMRDYYQAGESSQKLKYHIQTSGRSLHAQEMDFNDIRTTLQALLALYDNCNSLHTNAFDEALTTPTEASVRRAMAIQLIINNEFGPNKCENINQGSYFLDELTDLVEEAVLQEFESLSNRGGVLGAMESLYMRNKIQEESMYYEQLKHSGELPLIGVNTFINPHNSGERAQAELIRASYDEKTDQLNRLAAFQAKNHKEREKAILRLRECALADQNIFAELVVAVRHLSLGEISAVLYDLGGAYRRSM